MIAKLQVLPTPVGTVTHRWAHVDAASVIVACNDLVDGVGPPGTCPRGALDALSGTICKPHEATQVHSASGVATVIEVLDDTHGASTLHDR